MQVVPADGNPCRPAEQACLFMPDDLRNLPFDRPVHLHRGMPDGDGRDKLGEGPLDAELLFQARQQIHRRGKSDVACPEPQGMGHHDQLVSVNAAVEIHIADAPDVAEDEDDRRRPEKDLRAIPMGDNVHSPDGSLIEEMGKSEREEWHHIATPAGAAQIEPGKDLEYGRAFGLNFLDDLPVSQHDGPPGLAISCRWGESSRFEDTLDGKFKSSILRGPAGEVNVGKFLDDFQQNVDKAKDRFAPNYAASAEVQTILRQAAEIDGYFRGLPGGFKGASEWDRLAMDLRRLAQAYGTA